MSAKAQHRVPPEFGGQRRAECFNTNLPLPSLQRSAYRAKKIFTFKGAKLYAVYLAIYITIYMLNIKVYIFYITYFITSFNNAVYSIIRKSITINNVIMCFDKILSPFYWHEIKVRGANCNRSKNFSCNLTVPFF